jgi:hypothetical protein
MNKSLTAQDHITNTANPDEWDFIFIQEPYLDFLNNTRTSAQWVVIYPPLHLDSGAPRTRSVILVNKKIPSDTYFALPIQSADITALNLSMPNGDISLFNIYNSCTDNKSIEMLGDYLKIQTQHPRQRTHPCMYWLGDFNRHHPLWEEDQNPDLTSSEEMINPLLDLINEFNMVLTLPPGIPTLEVLSSGTWMRPDNVWCSDSAVKLTLKCDVIAELRPPLTDHLPIVMEIDLEVARNPPVPKKCFKNTDWSEFKDKLQEITQQTQFISHPMTSADIDTLLEQITATVTKAVDEMVPDTKPSPYMKRWWNKNLTQAHQTKRSTSRESNRWRGILMHEAHIRKLSQGL